MDNDKHTKRSAGRPALHVRALTMASEHRYLGLLLAAVVVVAGLWATAGLVRASSGPDRTTTAAPAVAAMTAPKDGALRVGPQSVPQMLGSCDGRSCYHLPPAYPVLVPVPASGTLALKAGVSIQFTVSAFNVTTPGAPAPVRVDGGALQVGKLLPGHYQITITGHPRGGVWQFQIDAPVATPAKAAGK